MKNSLRFNVFKRDGFVCQYCGRRPPEIILEIDHIIPKGKKGTDIIENLITSCFECNRGKRDKLLTEIPKSRVFALKEIEEKRQQLKAFYKFQKEIVLQKEKEIDDIDMYWNELWDGRYSLNTYGRGTIKMFLKWFAKEEIKEAMILSLKFNDVSRSFRYMCGVLHTKRKQRTEKL